MPPIASNEPIDAGVTCDHGHSLSGSKAICPMRKRDLMEGLPSRLMKYLTLYILRNYANLAICLT